jgi:hypothetical protein
MATLTIPEQFAPWMRIGALRELMDEAQGLKGTTKKTAEEIRKEEFYARHDVGVRRQSLEWLVDDTTCSLRSFAEEIPVGLQILEGKSDIEGTPGALAYMVDSMCRRVIPEELADLTGPLDPHEGEDYVAPITEALRWADEEASRLRAICSGEDS